MNQLHNIKPQLALLALAAIACLPLISCDGSFEGQDQAFTHATQKHLAGEIQKQATLLAAADKQLASVGKPAAALPADFKPWWAQAVEDKMFSDSQPAKEGLEDLLARALKTSSQIKVFSDIPLIRQTGIREARGEFDTHLFAESAYQYTNDPVGSVLTTGGPERFLQYETRIETGIKKKLLTGAEVALSERVAYTKNNSIYFEPDPQASAVLALTVVQPLLKGGGVRYNSSYIRIAKLDTEIGKKEFIRQAETHLLEINRSYWSLYLARAITAQKAKLVKDTAAVVEKLQKRSDIDAMRSELDRAKAALAKRRADLVRAEMGIKNTEDRIKALINDPTLMPSSSAELLPANAPNTKPMDISLKDAAATALECRPEIAQAFLQLKTAAIRLDMAKNEVMPQLDLILQTSVGGLDHAGQITDGWDDQWKDGSKPAYMVGLRFDYPLENNAGEARLLRRKLEIRQQLAQIQTTVDTVLLEVKIAARELQTSYHEMLSRYESLQASQEDLKTVEKRWDSTASGDNKSGVGYLQFLIETQDRLAQAEEDFSTACTIYNVAMVNLQRAQGTLLRYENLKITREEDAKGLPVLNLERIGAAPTSAPAAAPTTAPAPAPAPTTAPAAPAAKAAPAAEPAAKAAPAPTPATPAAAAPAPAAAPDAQATPAPAPAASTGATTRPVARYSLWPPQ